MSTKAKLRDRNQGSVTEKQRNLCQEIKPNDILGAMSAKQDPKH